MGFEMGTRYARNPFSQRGLQKYYKMIRELLLLSRRTVKGLWGENKR